MTAPAPSNRKRWWLLAITATLASGAGIASCAIFTQPELSRDEEVVFYPTVARSIDAGKRWECTIHGCVFEPETDDAMRSALLATIRTSIGIDSQSETELFRQRVGRFLVDNQRGKRLTIQIANRNATLPATAANGQARTTTIIDAPAARAAAVQGQLRFTTTPDAQGRQFRGRVFLIPPTGLSVISDIDDTIKLSNVTDKDALMRATFLEKFRSVDGMAALYRRWAKERDACFHFVSGSPWQLYTDLADFANGAGFPPASYHLRSVRLKDSTALALTGDPVAYKFGHLEPLFLAFPRRRFLLVGDSGEKDPEVYGKVARRFETQIEKILIRNVTKEKPGSERMRRAFRGLPDRLWQVFDQPAAIELN